MKRTMNLHYHLHPLDRAESTGITARGGALHRCRTGDGLARRV